MKVGVVGLLPAQAQALRKAVPREVELVFSRKRGKHEVVTVERFRSTDLMILTRFVSHGTIRRVKTLGVPIVSLSGGLSEIARVIEARRAR